MKTFAMSVLGIVCSVAAVATDDTAVEEKLRALGGKVTVENGVATNLTFADLMQVGRGRAPQEDLKRMFWKFDQLQLREQPALKRLSGR